MSRFVQVFRCRVNPDNAEALSEIRGKAIAQAQSVCPELLHTELVRVSDDTWLDILTWSRADGAEVLMAKAEGLSLLGEMHGLLDEVLDMSLGEVVHSTRR